MGEVDPTLLDHRPLAQHPCSTATTTFATPGIFHKAPASIGLLQATADIILQLQQEGFYLGHIRFAHFISCQTGIMHALPALLVLS